MKRPPYLHRTITRHGRVAWYFWRGKGHKKIRIRGEYGSTDFNDDYASLLAGAHSVKKETYKHAPESLAWLVARYKETSAWSELAQATRRQRDNIFQRVIAVSGQLPYTSITKAHILTTRDAKKATPSAANNFLQAMKGLFDWALERDYVAINPVVGVKAVRRPKNEGFRQWTEEEIAQFEVHWPVGTRERLALAVMLYTGLRRGDAARLGKQHFTNGRIKIVTEKTKTQVSIPVAPQLASIVENSPTGELFLVANTITGRGMTKESFATWFKRAAKAAGVPGNCHGLRKAAAVRLAEAGATIPELNAVFGWSGTAMASLYIEKANREILADNAAAKLRAK